MKKTLLILLVTIVLAACGSDKSNSSEPNEEPAKAPDQSEATNSDESKNDKNQSEDKSGDESEDKEDADEQSSDADNSAIKEFDEYDVIADHIDLDKYTGTVQTDNEGNRVILFEDENGNKEYKSVFVKHDKHLKIISLNDDTAPLYNGNID